MNFKPELAAAVMAGEKTVTRRLVSDNPRSPWWREKCAYRVGQMVAICPGRGKVQIGRVRIVSVGRMRLGSVDDREATREGFGNLAEFPRHEFREAWTAINGAYDEDAIVWRIGLEAIT